MKRRVIPLFLGVAIFILWLFYSNPAKILENISKANPYFILLGIVLTLVTTSLKSIRWKLLLKDINVNVSFGLAFSTFSSGLLISLFTPGRIGEPIRAYLLKKKIGGSVSEALPLIVLERAIDLLVVLIFSMLSLITLGFVFSPEEAFFFNLSAVFTVFALSLAILALVYKDFGNFLLEFMAKIPKIGKFKPKMEYVLKNFYASSAKIRKRTIFYTILLTLAAWLIEGLILLSAVKSLGFDIQPLLSIEIMALSTLIGLVSSLPGGLGSLEAVMSLFLAQFISGSAAATLIYRFTTIWFSIFLGLIILIGMFGLRRVFESIK